MFLLAFRWRIKIRCLAERSIAGAQHGPRWGVASAGFGAGTTCIIALIQSGHSLERLSVVLLALLASSCFSVTCYCANWIRVSLSLGIVLRSLVIVAVIWGGAVWLGIEVWPPIHRHALSAAEKNAFENALKEVKNPTVRVQLVCAPNDEVDCEYATELIPLFGEAHWDISPEIGRVTLTRPQAGITLARRNPSQKEPQKWDEGTWLAMTPDMEQAYQAFANIRIEPDETAGVSIPENQINIYVGHERENEAEPTPLTRYMQQIREIRKKWNPAEAESMNPATWTMGFQKNCSQENCGKSRGGKQGESRTDRQCVGEKNL
jgi:hypothetical protein